MTFARFFLAILMLALRAAADDLPAGARMSYLDNGKVKVGVDLNRGGAIVYLSRAGGGNLVNNFDRGRQVQLSFYSGPVPYSTAGQHPKKHWEHLGWNPVQAGDDFGNGSEILTHENDGHTLHVRCRPMQWPLNHVVGECVFSTWLELDGPAVKVRARLENAREDRRAFAARLQELPAAYANAPYHRVVSYTGPRPFQNEAVSEIPRSQVSHPWTFWNGTEGWSALLNESDKGLGVITPDRVRFTGGFAGKPGPNDTLGNATGYLAGQSLEILDHNIDFEYRFELVAGSLQEIRDRATRHRPAGLPAWDFSGDRQHWHFQNAADTGWPMKDHWHIQLEHDDPQLIGPHSLWRAEQGQLLVIEAAFRTDQRQGTVYWQALERDAPGAGDRFDFPIDGDAQFRRIEIDLSQAKSYAGVMTRLRVDPVSNGEPGAWVKVRSIRLETRRKR